MMNSVIEYIVDVKQVSGTYARQIYDMCLHKVKEKYDRLTLEQLDKIIKEGEYKRATSDRAQFETTLNYYEGLRKDRQKDIVKLEDDIIHARLIEWRQITKTFEKVDPTYVRLKRSQRFTQLDPLEIEYINTIEASHQLGDPIKSIYSFDVEMYTIHVSLDMIDGIAYLHERDIYCVDIHIDQMDISIALTPDLSKNIYDRIDPSPFPTLYPDYHSKYTIMIHT